MNRIICILLSFISISYISYKKESLKSDQIKLTENVLHNPNLGWSMEVPKGWQNISTEENENSRNKFNEQFSNIPTNLKSIDNFGFVLKKNKYNTFTSIYFPNQNNSYTKLTFKEEKLEKFNILKNYNSYTKLDSTQTKPLKIGNRLFDYYSFIVYFEDGNPIKMTSFTSKIKDYQLIVTLKTEDSISEAEILGTFYKSEFN